MTKEEEIAWYEAGLSAHGCRIDDCDKDAIVRYGRILHQRLLTELHSLRMQNSGQAALIERHKARERAEAFLRTLDKWEEVTDKESLMVEKEEEK